MLDTLLSTDSATPYIIKRFSTSFAVTSSAFGTVGESILPHGLPFTPLAIGVWLDSGTGLYRDIANERPDGPFSMPSLVQWSGADSTNIYLGVIDSKFPYVTTTYSFRVAVLCPPNFTGDTGVSGSFDDTDYNFSSDRLSPPIVDSGTTTVPMGTTEQVPHGLAYTPRCKIWSDDTVRQSTFTYITGAHPTTRVDDTYIYLEAATSRNTTFTYHIYGDNVWA